ncbi:MAG TPA: hypothetical protein VNN74_01070 [Candidatus Micrarchaeia archaeon]|nr:hypothetical protein [Candidatus Micrarchaeia archaeon]
MLHLPALPAERPVRLPRGLVWDARVRWRLARRRHPVRRIHLVAAGLLVASCWVGLSLLSGWRLNTRLEREAARLGLQDRATAGVVARDHAQLQAAAAPGWAGELARAQGMAAPSQAVYVITGPRPTAPARP